MGNAQMGFGPSETLTQAMAVIFSTIAQAEDPPLISFVEEVVGAHLFRMPSSAMEPSHRILRLEVTVPVPVLPDGDCIPFGEPETQRDRIEGAAKLIQAAQLLMDDDPPEARRLAAKAGQWLLGTEDSDE